MIARCISGRIPLILLAAAALACNVSQNLGPTRTPFPTVTPTFSPAAYGTMVAQTAIAASQTPLPPPIPTHIIQDTDVPRATNPPGSTPIPGATTEPGACANEWFMPNPPNDSCPGPLAQSNAAYEPFEHGFMLWIEQSGLITVFFNALNGGPTYASTSNPWHDGLPQSDPGIVPPDDRYQPIRGFGMVWRGESSGMPTTPRDVLGWATAQETGYVINVQCADQPDQPDCFYSLPDGRVIQIRTNSSQWAVWNGPR